MMMMIMMRQLCKQEYCSQVYYRAADIMQLSQYDTQTHTHTYIFSLHDDDDGEDDVDDEDDDDDIYIMVECLHHVAKVILISMCGYSQAERRRHEARRETFTTPELVTTRRSRPAEGRPGPNDDDDDNYEEDEDEDDDDVL